MQRITGIQMMLGVNQRMKLLKRYQLPLLLPNQVMLVVQRPGLVYYSKCPFIGKINKYPKTCYRTKPEPVVEAEPVKEEEKTQHHEPVLQKVDDAWLSSDSKWDQPLQLPTLLDKKEEEPVVVEKAQSVTPPSAPATTTATVTAAVASTPVAAAPAQIIEKEISVDFTSLSLQETPETT